MRTCHVQRDDGWTDIMKKPWEPNFKIAWKKPPKNCNKINVDGRYKVVLEKGAPTQIFAGYGLVVRDHSGNALFIAFAATNPVDPLFHELEGIKAALEIIEVEKYVNVIISCDCARAIDYIKGSLKPEEEKKEEHFRDELKLIIDSIRSKLPPRDDLFEYIEREANDPADFVAKLPTYRGLNFNAVKGIRYRFMPENFPQRLKEKIAYDKKGGEYNRKSKRCFRSDAEKGIESSRC